jgi:hypothetical protein
MGKVRLDAMPASGGSYCWGMKDEEYMADFCLVSRRALEEPEYLLFKYHFLLGADWRLCGRRLNMDRGSFFHQIYRIEQKLGRVYRELRPHALFPLDEYFGGSVRKELPEAYLNVVQMPLPAREQQGVPLRAPLKKVA